jgi:hypothetical protein
LYNISESLKREMWENWCKPSYIPPLFTGADPGGRDLWKIISCIAVAIPNNWTSLDQCDEQFLKQFDQISRNVRFPFDTKDKGLEPAAADQDHGAKQKRAEHRGSREYRNIVLKLEYEGVYRCYWLIPCQVRETLGALWREISGVPMNEAQNERREKAIRYSESVVEKAHLDQKMAIWHDRTCDWTELIKRVNDQALLNDKVWCDRLTKGKRTSCLDIVRRSVRQSAVHSLVDQIIGRDKDMQKYRHCNRIIDGQEIEQEGGPANVVLCFG